MPQYKLEIITSIDAHSIDFCLDKNNQLVDCSEIPELPWGSHWLIVQDEQEIVIAHDLLLCVIPNGNFLVRDIMPNNSEKRQGLIKTISNIFYKT
ncbi:MAG: hypothetical protein JXA43_01870 [Candidatus Diapherotrites archaeon]|nr:hypothetical protein [Candidatus Diapherotrites archaeon]